MSRAGQVRRLQLTISMDTNEPLEARFLELYDNTDPTGFRRQEFLRRSLMIGVMVQSMLDKPDVLEEVARMARRPAPAAR